METIIEPNWNKDEKKALPLPNSDVLIRCIDGKIRKGRYEPSQSITPWIFDDGEMENEFERISITGWSYRDGS